MNPALQPLLDFLRAQRATPPASGHFHGIGVLDNTSEFLSMARFQAHLNTPTLTHEWLTLYKRGERVPLEPFVLWKTVLGKKLMFMDKQRINAELADGAAVLLEGLDILDANVNAFAAQVDAQMPCALSNAVAFFSQRGHEAYKGHRDTDDVLVIQLSGQKTWEIFEPQQRRYLENNDLSREEMGKLAAKITMNPGDALFVRAGVPHLVQTTGAHSLHVSFDLIDRTPNIEQITAQANQRYNQGTAPPHVSAAKMVEHYTAILQAPAFQNALVGATAQTKADAQRFRARIGHAHAITALSRFF
jgi:hypothetical protein